MFPVAWALMEGKTTQAYYDVLQKFNTEFPEIQPLTINGDYKSAFRSAALQVYNTANFQGCHTHYHRVNNFYILNSK